MYGYLENHLQRIQTGYQEPGGRDGDVAMTSEAATETSDAVTRTSEAATTTSDPVTKTSDPVTKASEMH